MNKTAFLRNGLFVVCLGAMLLLPLDTHAQKMVMAGDNVQIGDDSSISVTDGNVTVTKETTRGNLTVSGGGNVEVTDGNVTVTKSTGGGNLTVTGGGNLSVTNGSVNVSTDNANDTGNINVSASGITPSDGNPYAKGVAKIVYAITGKHPLAFTNNDPHWAFWANNAIDYNSSHWGEAALIQAADGTTYLNAAQEKMLNFTIDGACRSIDADEAGDRVVLMQDQDTEYSTGIRMGIGVYYDQEDMMEGSRLYVRGTDNNSMYIDSDATKLVFTNTYSNKVKQIQAGENDLVIETTVTGSSVDIHGPTNEGVSIQDGGYIVFNASSSALPSGHPYFRAYSNELYAHDSSGGNGTQLSSHKSPKDIAVFANATVSFDDPSVELPISVSHMNTLIGKGQVVDTAKMYAYLDAKMKAELGQEAGRIIYTYDLPSSECLTADQWLEQAREGQANEVMRKLESSPWITVSDGVGQKIPAEAIEEVDEYTWVPQTKIVEEKVADLETLEIKLVQKETSGMAKVPTGKKIRRFKDGWKFESGKLLRRPTVDDIDIAKIVAQTPQVPQWVQARMKSSLTVSQSTADAVADLKSRVETKLMALQEVQESLAATESAQPVTR